MIRFLLDENFNGKIVRGLALAGVIIVRDTLPVAKVIDDPLGEIVLQFYLLSD
jgi:hypothetical protein